jgi:DNA-binding NarL/FixJ family response regulator
MISIGIAEDHRLLSVSLKEYLKANLACDVIFEAVNGTDLLKKLDEFTIDILIMDVSMPLMDGLEALKLFRTDFPELKVIALTMYDDDELIYELFQNKINAFLSKSSTGPELIMVIERVMKFGQYLDEKVLRALLNYPKEKVNPEKISLDSLDEIDIEILKLICKEYTSFEIAAELRLSKRTIDGRRERLLVKTGAVNLIGLVVYALRQGIIS